MQQSISFARAIPIKKRRFPIIESASPSPEEKPSVSEVNEQESKIPDAKPSSFEENGKELKIQDEKPSSSDNIKEKSHICGADTDVASTGKSDLSKSSAFLVTDTNVKSAQANVETKPQKPEPAISLGPKDDLMNKADLLSTEESDGGAHIMILKQENVSGQTDGICGIKLSTASQNVELPLEPNKPFVPALEHQSNKAICGKSVESDHFLFSLSVSKDKLILGENNDSSTKYASSRDCANRSNWDLNTSMDEWEGSTNNVSFAHKSSQTSNSLRQKSSLNNHDVKTTAGTVGPSLYKGKHMINEHGCNSCNTDVQTSQQCNDSLRLSLAMPFRELDASGKQSSLPKKLDSTDSGPKLNLMKSQSSTMNLNRASASANCRTLKLEPVDENSKRDCSIDSSSSNMGSLKLSPVKREFVEKHSSEIVLPLSISPQKLVGHTSIKSELVQESINEVSKLKDSVVPQYVGRVMLHQESSASSSAMSMPLTPQSSCPSRLSTCSELTLSGGQSQLSFHSEVHGNKDIPNKQITAMVSKPFGIRNLNVEDSRNFELTRVNEHPSELCGNGEIAANNEEKIDGSSEMLEEETFGSDCESYENRAVATPMDGVKLCNKEDGEYEEGELRESLQHSTGEGAIALGKKTENLQVVERDSGNLQPFVLSGDQSTNTSDFDGKSAISENHDEPHSDHIKESVIIGYEPCSEDNSFKKLPVIVPEVGVEEKRSISVTIEQRLDLSRQKDVEREIGEEVSSDGPTNGSHGIGTGLIDKATDPVVKEICSEKHDSTFSMVEASINGTDAAKDSNNVGNKSRIITLPRASVATTSCRTTRSIPNRLLTTRSGKERSSDFDGDTHRRGNRNEFYTGGSNKYPKDRDHDMPLRDSRPRFMRGKGRGSGNFGSLHDEWDSDHDFASETYNGPSDYRVSRHNKLDSSIADVDLGYNHNGYGIGPDGPSIGSNRRKAMNDDKFMRHLSDDMIDGPVYTRPQPMYEEFDGPLMRGNRNFSNMQRNCYSRIQSKSPVRFRTRSPGPWSTRRRRSPDELPETNQNRSPAAPLYRMRRMRSPDRACFRDEMVSRRRGSPSYVTRHSNDSRDVDSGPEHVHPRSLNSNRRSPPPTRVFPRTARRDVLDSRERGDGSIDERRKFIERRGPIHSFRPSYNGGDNDNFRFHVNDGPRPYRFCPDADREFVERSNIREREFDGRIKHQPLVVSRRIRDIEEQQDGTHRPGGRVWHDDGFNDVSEMKRRRF
ncbi:hypothetical protein ACJIZ3_009578 [Penstemon smallii]|uniref:Uncharacterized protein n=1 Tax=Penstemon smallii TaxID=265156 RepID=A0ABD3TCX0_9LAMI